MIRFIRRARERLAHIEHYAHRSEQFVHVALYGSLFVGMKEVYVAMGGVAAVVALAIIIAGDK